MIQLVTTGNRVAIAIATALFAVLPAACSMSTAGPRIAAYDEPQTALILLDLQRDFLAPTGRLPVASSQVGPMLAAVDQLTARADAKTFEVIYVVNEFDPSDAIANWFRNRAAIRGDPGAELDPRVPRGLGRTFSKSTSDAFANERFDSYLRKRKVAHLIVAGVFANACVKHTIGGGLNRGYQVTLVRDAVAAASPEDVEEAVADLAARGVAVRNSADILASLDDDQRHQASGGRSGSSCSSSIRTRRDGVSRSSN